MDQQLLQARQLTMNDLAAFKMMETGIDDDYVIRIFDRLVESPTQELFGLFLNEQLISLAGYSLFGQDRFAMIGRLRSDLRYRGQGYATELLKPVINHIKDEKKVKWIGANTHVSNYSARRLLEKSGLKPGTITYYLTLLHPSVLTHYQSGARWNEIPCIDEKRTVLLHLQNNQLGLFPYECYYPFPYDADFFTDEYLSDAKLYINPAGSRFVLIKNDQKKYDYSHVKYFWNDHYEQPGFFETIIHHWKDNPRNVGCWIDFSEQGFHKIPDLTPYEVQKPWILYGDWV
ncbi:GNAT family N-acetyltransferase [Halobacillus sp. B23F22_1]|uniref:GNAT family N-acetyltransferase n=1 Tax=Halobacillus sp. B23F22_1 TaxID=3459514 RepID=UPI00373E6EF5